MKTKAKLKQGIVHVEATFPRSHVKGKAKGEKGITLVALIITIIILIILAAVTIKSFWDSHFIDLAMQGAVNYTKAQGEELNILNDIQVKIDEAIPKITQTTWKEENEEMILELTGTTKEGFEETGWYTKVNITVTPKLANTKATGVYITGAKTETKTLQDGNAIFEIDTEGENQRITAQLIDGAGNNLAEITSNVFSIDKTTPISASLSIGSYTKDSISVTAMGEDNIGGSGIYKYKYEISTDGTNFTGAKIDASSTYTYEGLKAGITYYLQVTAMDKAGNEFTGQAITKTIEREEITLPDTTIPEGYETVGKYVNYTPKPDSYTALAKYTGATDDQVFTTDTSLKWRIWRANSNELILFPDRMASETNEAGEKQTSLLEMKGCNGVDNGPTILNSMAKTLYSSPNVGEAFSLRSSESWKASGLTHTDMSVIDYTQGAPAKPGKTSPYIAKLPKLTSETYFTIMEECLPLSECSLVDTGANSGQTPCTARTFNNEHPLSDILANYFTATRNKAWVATRFIFNHATSGCFDGKGSYSAGLEGLEGSSANSEPYLWERRASLVQDPKSSMTSLSDPQEKSVCRSLFPLVRINLETVRVCRGDDLYDYILEIRN